MQRVTDESGEEITGDSICALFKQEYFDAGGTVSRVYASMVTVFGRRVSIAHTSGVASGEDYARSVAQALGIAASIVSFETVTTTGGDTAAFVGCHVGDDTTRFGVAVHANPALAVVDAVVSAVNRSKGIVQEAPQDEVVEA